MGNYLKVLREWLIKSDVMTYKTSFIVAPGGAVLKVGHMVCPMEPGTFSYTL